jgi:hypothetical protein
MKLLRSLRPLALPAPLLAGALVVGGLPGVIVGFFAVLLAIDRLLERLASFTGWGMFAAERRFVALTRRHRRDDLLRRLRRLPPERLEHLDEEDPEVTAVQRRALGLQTIPIASIAGSVDRQKALDFDACWRPPRWSRQRWTQMAHAAQSGATLPPIAVYRLGDRHYVRDGHHRVSVARALGAESAEAQVVELAALRRSAA